MRSQKKFENSSDDLYKKISKDEFNLRISDKNVLDTSGTEEQKFGKKEIHKIKNILDNIADKIRFNIFSKYSYSLTFYNKYPINGYYNEYEIYKDNDMYYYVVIRDITRLVFYKCDQMKGLSDFIKNILYYEFI